MMADAVAPPARLPWDVAAIAAEAMRVLRLEAQDADTDRIAAAADTATVMIDDELDYETAPETIRANIQAAAVQLTVEMYRAKDAPFGVIDAWSADGTAFRLPSDRMRGVRSLLVNSKARWGIG